jgi:hypothetical protein
MEGKEWRRRTKSEGETVRGLNNESEDSEGRNVEREDNGGRNGKGWREAERTVNAKRGLETEGSGVG